MRDGKRQSGDPEVAAVLATLAHTMEALEASIRGDTHSHSPHQED